LRITSSQRGSGWAALLLLVALPGAAYSRAHHSESHHGESWARDHFAAAERMREALNGRPPADRTRRDYQRVLNAYRNVYFGAPASAKADPSVVAVAETLVEMGRRFDDDKILNEAIAQYRFLRREYPGSKYRCDALFTIGEIYKDDLNDAQQARTVFEEFLQRYPHNRLVEDAQSAVAELDRQAEAEKKAEAQKSAKTAADKSRGSKDSIAKSVDARPDAADSRAQHASHLPRVTGIRHWSTPDYTRVAIDLESEVKFGSQRIADPDRIFFDLRDTKLASTLVGKSFDVDDGFLKKIRVAQFQPGRTRVVLEVDNLSDYEAFLLPNPYRLIIDIHGKDGKAARAKAPKDGLTADVEAGPKAGSRVDAAAASSKGNLQAAKAEDGDSDARGVLPAESGSGKGPVAAALKRCAGQNPSGASCPATTKSGDDKPATDGVKKVIVEADDDDSEPAPAAKTEASIAPSRPPAAARKPDSLPDSEASVGDERSADSAPVPSPMRGKATGRLASGGTAADLDIHEARPTATGDRSLIRALGLKIGRIVIDPGHGGHDTGTIGPNGLEEKDLVLEVGRRLGKLLETRLGAEVVYTRKDDTFIPLETRTAIANQQRADLFISIHANSSRDESARGVETYYLNFTSSPEALEVAARENAVSEKSIYELQDLVKKIALKEKIEESREFAGDVQESLHSGLAAKSPGIRNRGVKKAPFIVLIGANMPSILAEISFVSNPGDEHRLETSDYRQRIAESLYRGIAKYVNGLSGVKVAAKMDKGASQ
jgi:N-acetylmuramoyl-L-alanine amidase